MLRTLELEDPMSAVLNQTDWKQEVPNGTDFVIRRSRHVWSLNDGHDTLVIFGLYEPTLMSKAELWLLMPQGFSKQLRRNMKFAKNYVLEMLHEYPLLRAHTKEPAAAKFVRVLGFTELGPKDIGGVEYLAWELRA